MQTMTAESAKLAGDEREREALWRELRSLNESLVAKIPAYESRHSEAFVHAGTAYMDIMHKDIPLLTKYAESITQGTFSGSPGSQARGGASPAASSSLRSGPSSPWH